MDVFHRLFTIKRSSPVLMVILTLFMQACSGDVSKPNIPEKEPVSILTGKPGGVPLVRFFENKNPTDNAMPVNALLWRASLDIASFVPLSDVDTFSGTIITEWYQETENSDQRLKLSFFVLGQELRSDAIKVRAYLQKRQGAGWIDTGQDEKLAYQLENLILSRARELRSATIGETEK